MSCICKLLWSVRFVTGFDISRTNRRTHTYRDRWERKSNEGSHSDTNSSESSPSRTRYCTNSSLSASAEFSPSSTSYTVYTLLFGKLDDRTAVFVPIHISEVVVFRFRYRSQRLSVPVARDVTTNPRQPHVMTPGRYCDPRILNILHSSNQGCNGGKSSGSNGVSGRRADVQ
jgi:hypothetical protein